MSAEEAAPVVDAPVVEEPKVEEPAPVEEKPEEPKPVEEKPAEKKFDLEAAKADPKIMIGGGVGAVLILMLIFGVAPVITFFIICGLGYFGYTKRDTIAAKLEEGKKMLEEKKKEMDKKKAEAEEKKEQ